MISELDYMGAKMKYFVSSDIHGYYDEWMKALGENGFDEKNPEHKLIVCGDLFDRGSQPNEVQTFVMDMLAKDKIILIRGNHEDLATSLVDSRGYIGLDSDYDVNGTLQTLMDLLNLDKNFVLQCVSEFRRRAKNTDYISKIIPSMKNYYETEHYVFVHAWLPLSDTEYALCENWREASDTSWEEARWLEPIEAYKGGLTLKDKTQVCGHRSSSIFWAYAYPNKYAIAGENACYKPFINKEVIALDGCTYYSKKVNVVVLED